MKKRMLTPIAAIAVATLTMVGCASSNDGMNDTTAMDGTTMSETETMGGRTDAETGTGTGTGTGTETGTGTGTETGTGTGTGTGTETGTGTGVGTGTGTGVGTETGTDASMSTDMTYADMFDDIDNTEQYDIMGLARTNPNLSTFVSLAEMAGMEDALNNAGSDFTIFIPTNEAFEALPKEEYDRLVDPANKTELIKVLQAHVLPDNIATSQFQNNQRIQTTDGKNIDIAVTGTGGAGANNMVTIGGANVVKADVRASNGTVHIIDGVIRPTENTDGLR